VWAAYEERKQRAGVLDLDDLLAHCAEAIEGDPGFAAAQRWRFRHLFVDEAQDLTPAQWRLIRAWQGERADLFLVGDPHQSIYGWSGAHAGVLVDPASHLPGATVLRLTHNHRCRPHIVVAAAAALGSPASATATRPPADLPRLVGAASEAEEAAAVAGELADALRLGRRPTDLAVLARTHARLEAIAAACDERRVPVVRPGSARRWTSRPEIAAVLDDLATAPVRTGLAGALSRSRHDLAHHAGAVDEVATLVGEYLALEPHGDLGGFVSWLDTCEPPPPGGAVTLSTFHGAKGREWASVWVTGLDAIGDEPEARRLVHVALSRAVDELTITWSGRRSPVVDAIDAAVSVSGAAPVDWRSELAAVRVRLREVTASAKG
jgi:DNA helicase-2/ATP-dependent DNA helicase PcrA